MYIVCCYADFKNNTAGDNSIDTIRYDDTHRNHFGESGLRVTCDSNAYDKYATLIFGFYWTRSIWKARIIKCNCQGRALTFDMWWLSVVVTYLWRPSTKRAVADVMIYKKIRGDWWRRCRRRPATCDSANLRIFSIFVLSFYFKQRQIFFLCRLSARAYTLINSTHTAHIQCGGGNLIFDASDVITC